MTLLKRKNILIKKIDFHIKKLNSMKRYPNNLYYIGNVELLNKNLISVVGSRKPNQYSREMTYKIINQLANKGNIIVSGGAIGIDTIAHKAAGLNNTIMIAGTGLDKRYPAINRTMIEKLEHQGLILSQFEKGTPSRKYNFPLRNELLVSLGEILIVAYADINSGTMRSIEYALKMKKEIYVLPHRLGESMGTNKLLAQGKVKAIYDIDSFIKKFEKQTYTTIEDTFLEYCKINQSYDEVLLKFGEKVFEYELLGKIEIKNGKIFIL